MPEYDDEEESLSVYDAVFRAKVTGSVLVDGVYRHAFVEQAIDPASGKYTTPEAARYGATGRGWLTATDGSQIADDTIVWAAFTGTVDGASVYDAAAPGGAAPASPTFSGARVYLTAGQTITNNTITSILFDAEYYDIDGYHDNTANQARLTVPTTGYYLVGAYISWGANATGERFARLVQSNNLGLQFTVDSDDATGQATTARVVHLCQPHYISSLADAPFFYLWVRQTSGVSLAVNVIMFAHKLSVIAEAPPGGFDGTLGG